MRVGSRERTREPSRGWNEEWSSKWMKVRGMVREKHSVGVLGAALFCEVSYGATRGAQSLLLKQSFCACSKLIKIAPILHINCTPWACRLCSHVPVEIQFETILHRLVLWRLSHTRGLNLRRIKFKLWRLRGLKPISDKRMRFSFVIFICGTV